MPFDEAEFSIHASRILQRYAAPNTKDAFEPAPSWLLLSLELHKATFPLLEKDEPPSWVSGLYAELGAYIVEKSGQYSDYYLGMILEPFYPIVTVARSGTGLSSTHYKRLREYLGVASDHLDAAEVSLLLRIADAEDRSAQSGY